MTKETFFNMLEDENEELAIKLINNASNAEVMDILSERIVLDHGHLHNSKALYLCLERDTCSSENTNYFGLVEAIFAKLTDQQKIDVLEPNHRDNKALARAVSTGDLKNAQLLLQQYATEDLKTAALKNWGHHSALRNAAKNGNIEIISFLWKQYPTDELRAEALLAGNANCALKLAVENDHYNTAKLIISLAVDMASKGKSFDTANGFFPVEFYSDLREMISLDTQSEICGKPVENFKEFIDSIKEQKDDVIALADWRLANYFTNYDNKEINFCKKLLGKANKPSEFDELFQRYRKAPEKGDATEVLSNVYNAKPRGNTTTIADLPKDMKDIIFADVFNSDKQTVGTVAQIVSERRIDERNSLSKIAIAEKPEERINWANVVVKQDRQIRQ